MKRVFRQRRKVNVGLFKEFAGTHEGKRVRAERGGVSVVKLEVTSSLVFRQHFLFFFPLSAKREKDARANVEQPRRPLKPCPLRVKTVER